MNGNFWNEWQEFLMQEFERRLMAMDTKDNRVTPGQKASQPYSCWKQTWG